MLVRGINLVLGLTDSLRDRRGDLEHKQVRKWRGRRQFQRQRASRRIDLVRRGAEREIYGIIGVSAKF